MGRLDLRARDPGRRHAWVALAALAGVAVAVAQAAGAGPAPPGAPVPGADRTITLRWVGDTMLGTESAVPPAGGDALFAAVRGRLGAADLTFGNLEGVLAPPGGPAKCAPGAAACFAFRAAPALAGALGRAGFDVMNLANNHGWDAGAAGRRSTVAALRRAGVAATGGPGEVTVLTRRGVRVAFVGAAPYPWATSLGDLRALRALVRAARRRADVVVAAVHAGAEGAGQLHTPVGREVAYGEDRGDTRAAAHALVDAGADLVLGSGPHVVRGLERHRGRLIAYSLGNFAGWHNFAGGGALAQSGILHVRLTATGRPVGGRWLSLRLEPPGVPVPEPRHTSARLAGWLSRHDFGPRAVRVSPTGRLVLP